MKNANKIRQLLKDAIDYKNDYAYVYIIKKCKKALSLLPCETCGGAGNVGGSGYEDEQGNYVEIETAPCPDCQPCEKQKERI